MRLRLSTLPLVIGCATGAGATTALLLGTFVPGWGLTGGVALALATLSVGLFVVPGHRELLLVTVALSCFVLGFLVATVPASLVGLEDFVADKLPELRAYANASANDVRARLLVRWTVAGLAALGAGIVARRKRA
jgi:hypothetical protein